MTGWSASATVPQVVPTESLIAAARPADLAARRDRSQQMRWLAGNVLVALFYALFLYSAIKFFVRTGSLVGVGAVIFNTILVASLLTRRRPEAVTGSVRNWILAPLSQILPFLLRPAGSATGLTVLLSSVGQVVGLAIMIASLLVLNRSIGVVAANRGVKTRGVYAWIRHPLYAGEIAFFLSFLIPNWTYQNALLVSLLVLAQVGRSYQEEALLLRDERYAAYRAAVPYRLIPGVF